MVRSDRLSHASPLLRAQRRLGDIALRAPLPLVQVGLRLIAQRLARTRPDLFARMGAHARKRFLIDPVDLPLVALMIPDTSAPQLTAHVRDEAPAHDAAISGTFFNLLDMIDGTLDGDALFFNRDLNVTGDIEAVVAMRNALDDFDGDLVREILRVFGPFAGFGATAIGALRRYARRSPRAGAT